jgi:hypothetical protein
MKLTKRALTVCMIAGLATTFAANAQFHLPSALGGSPSASSGDAMASQDALVKSFVGSQIEVLAAQTLLAKAYDLKDSAGELELQQKALQGGAVDKDTLKKTIDISDKANEEITAQQSKQTTLTAEEKEYYQQSLPHFAKGVLGTREVIVQAQKFTSVAKGSMSGMGALSGGMTKLKAGAYVATATPSYSKNLFDVFRKTMSISQSNGVKIPSDATQAVGEL